MIPDYQSIMLPLLKILSDEKEHSNTELIELISNEFNLTEEDRNTETKSGVRLIDNRVGWAKTYLKKAKLVEYTKRGYVKITPLGKDILSKNPPKINNKFLEQFDDFLEFKSAIKSNNDLQEDNLLEQDDENIDPFESIEKKHNIINSSLKQDLLDKLRESTPLFFERTILKLIEKMGYGKGEVTGKSGDGGVDGIIYLDKLKIDKIYLQAKRYSENNLITSSMIRDFYGALDFKGVDKGIFITTSKFSRDIKNSYDSSKSSKKIILIDGNQLVDLMLEYNLGVYIKKTFEIKDIDENFFD
jgi:restriction system protein